MESVLDALYGLLITVLLGAISIASIYVKKYVSEAIDKIKVQNAKLKDEQAKVLIESALDNLNNLINTYVESAQVTIVKELKNSNKDTVKEDLIEVKDNMVYMIKNQLSEDSKDLLKNHIYDLDAYIENKIESTVGKLKGEI